MFIYKGKSLYLFTSTYHLLGSLLGLKKCLALPWFTHVLESYGGINLDFFFFKNYKERSFEIFPLNNPIAPWKSQWHDY